ncbi:cobalamin synthesis protein p47k, partial [Haematococcus lacustris]
MPLGVQVVETSGVGDAEPLAALLLAHGFRLEAVVAVVDAEAGLAALQQQAVARAQVSSADLVLLNKCDLAGLGAVADTEDLVQQVSPGVRML